jgi:hypothetical protein
MFTQPQPMLLFAVLRCCAGIVLQTDVYLEELTDVVPEADTTTQTDAFLDRPPTPQFVPTKSGTDAATQIEQGERTLSWPHRLAHPACLA